MFHIVLQHVMLAVRKTSDGEKTFSKMRGVSKYFLHTAVQVDFLYQVQRIHFIGRLHELVKSRSAH